MSGHNKWSKVKHKKAATDAKKSKIFSKLGRLITAESKKSGGEESPGLRIAIERAKAANMPKDVLERAIEKGKSGTAEALEEVLYESYGPGGTAIMIEGLTDNRNRTAAEIKHLLSTLSLSLSQPGAAAWAFEKEAGVLVPKTTVPLTENEREKLEQITETLLEHDDVQAITTNAA